MEDIVRPPERPNRSLRVVLDSRKETEKPKTETFKTPEEVAEADFVEENNTEKTENMTKPSSSKQSWIARIKPVWPPGKKEWGIYFLALVLIGGSIAAIAFTLNKPAPKKVVAVHVVNKPIVPPKPKTVASNLSGLQVDPTLNQRPVTGVMIENSQDARPQSGLSQASVVFEAIAEGGITRFLALFQDNSPDNVGPIRSARPYYVQWAMGFDAGYAHVGGSPEALANIRTWGARDLDQFANGGSYHRIAARAAPHNVYTSIAALNQLEVTKGYNTSTYTSLLRKTAPTAKQLAKKPATPSAKSIDMKLSGPLYNVHYDYSAATNSYNRSEAGAPHIDANTNAQISPNVVIALIMPYSLMSDGYHSQYQNIGTGQAYIFQDGGVTIGTWAKADNKSQLTLTDAANKPLGLNPGQTWLTALGSSGSVTYAP